MTTVDSYESVIKKFVRDLPTVQMPPDYSYHEADLTTLFAYRSGHSTNSERPKIVSILPSNFPLFSQEHSTTTAQKSQKSAKTSFHSSSQHLDFPSHVLELLQWSGGSGRGGASLTHIWLFGEWAEAAPHLATLLDSQCRVRVFTTEDIDKPVTQQLDWIMFLTSVRAQVPITDRIFLFFDWPHAASNKEERHRFMLLQLAALYIVKPDHALLHITLATEQHTDLKYPKGKLVIPMTDHPVVEQLLLWTSNEEYTSEFQKYSAGRIRDQFTFFVRETFEQVKYQDSMNGAVISYLIKRQQVIQSALATKGEQWDKEEVEAPELVTPMIFLRDVEFATNDGYVSIVLPSNFANRVDAEGTVPSEEEPQSEEDKWTTEKVFLFHVESGKSKLVVK